MDNGILTANDEIIETEDAPQSSVEIDKRVEVSSDESKNEAISNNPDQQKSEKVDPKPVLDPFVGDTAARFEVQLFDIWSDQTTEIHGMELLEEQFGKEPDSETSPHYTNMHNYWKSLEAKCVPKYASTLKRDRIEDLAGRYASFGVDSLSSNAGTDDTLTTDDMNFIDDSQFYDIYIPATMDTPYGGFYVNDEALHFEMLDGEREEQNEDKEIDDLSQDELEEKRKKKRKKKDIGDIVIAKKQKPDDASSTEKLFGDWTEVDFKLLKSSVRKFKTNWQLIKMLAFGDRRTAEECKKAWSFYQKMRKKDENATASTVSAVSSATDKTVGSQESILGPTQSSCDSGDDVSIVSANMTCQPPPNSCQHPSKPQQFRLDREDSDCELLNAEENLPLSLIKKKSIATSNQSSNNTAVKNHPDPFEREDVPLAKLKESRIQSFDSFLKELPPKTRNKIRNMLTLYKKCDGKKEQENQMFLRQVPKLLPHINALLYSRKFPNISNIEEHITSQFSSPESKDLFKSILTSTRSAMGAKLRLHLRRVTEVVKSEISAQQKHYDARVKVLMEKRPNFKDSVNNEENPVMPQKKFTYSKRFKEALKDLLEQYLSIYFAESVSGSREMVLRRYIQRRLMPLWSESRGSLNEATNPEGSTVPDEKTKPTKWVTLESLLTVSRQLLTPVASANKPVKTPKPNEETANKVGNNEPTSKEPSIVSQSFNKPVSASLAMMKPVSQNAATTDVASLNVTSKISSQSMPKTGSQNTVTKGLSQNVSSKGNTLYSGSTQKGKKNEILDSSNEDLDTPLASLLSVDRNSNVAAHPKSTNHSEAGRFSLSPSHVESNTECVPKTKSSSNHSISNNVQIIEQIVNKVSFGMTVPTEKILKTAVNQAKPVLGNKSWQSQPETSKSSAVNSAIQQDNSANKYRGSVYGRSMGSIAVHTEETSNPSSKNSTHMPILNAQLNSQISPSVNPDINNPFMSQKGHFKVSPNQNQHSVSQQKSPTGGQPFTYSISQNYRTNFYDKNQVMNAELQLKQLQLKLIQDQQMMCQLQAKANVTEIQQRSVFNLESPPESKPTYSPSMFTTHSTKPSTTSPSAQANRSQQATPTKGLNVNNVNTNCSSLSSSLPSFANTFPKHHSPTSATPANTNRSSNLVNDQRQRSLQSTPTPQANRTPLQPPAPPSTPQSSEQTGTERKLKFTSFLNPARSNSSPFNQTLVAPPPQSRPVYRQDDQVSPQNSSAFVQHLSPEHMDYMHQHYMQQLKQREQAMASSNQLSSQCRPMFSIESPEKR